MLEQFHFIDFTYSFFLAYLLIGTELDYYVKSYQIHYFNDIRILNIYTFKKSSINLLTLFLTNHLAPLLKNSSRNRMICCLEISINFNKFCKQR